MLVLTRKQDESITIRCPDGKYVNISVCRIDSNYKIRLGIEAPGDYKITRTELIEKSDLSLEEFFQKFSASAPDWNQVKASFQIPQR